MAKARTAKQKAALRKAQLASARKRKGKGRSRPRVTRRGLRTGAKVAGVAAAVGYIGYQTHAGVKQYKKTASNNRRVDARLKGHNRRKIRRYEDAVGAKHARFAVSSSGRTRDRGVYLGRGVVTNHMAKKMGWL